MGLNPKKPHHKMEPCHNMMYIITTLTHNPNRPPKHFPPSLLIMKIPLAPSYYNNQQANLVVKGFQRKYSLQRTMLSYASFFLRGFRQTGLRQGDPGLVTNTKARYKC